MFRSVRHAVSCNQDLIRTLCLKMDLRHTDSIYIRVCMQNGFKKEPNYVCMDEHTYMCKVKLMYVYKHVDLCMIETAIHDKTSLFMPVAWRKYGRLCPRKPQKKVIYMCKMTINIYIINWKRSSGKPTKMEGKLLPRTLKNV